MDAFLFGVFPYLAVAVTVVGAFRRFGAMRYTVTTFSSQLLESRLQYWGSVSWHYAILPSSSLHLVAIFIPGAMIAALSAAGSAGGHRGDRPGPRASRRSGGWWSSRVRRVTLRGETTWLDWTVMVLLLAPGRRPASTSRLHGALGLRPGSPHLATPWLASLVRLLPAST